MAQIAITLSPTLAISLTLAGASGASVQLTPPAPVVIAALGEVLRGPQGDTGPQGPKGDKGDKGDDGAADITSDPLAYYILAKA